MLRNPSAAYFVITVGCAATYLLAFAALAAPNEPWQGIIYRFWVTTYPYGLKSIGSGCFRFSSCRCSSSRFISSRLSPSARINSSGTSHRLSSSNSIARKKLWFQIHIKMHIKSLIESPHTFQIVLVAALTNEAAPVD